MANSIEGRDAKPLRAIGLRRKRVSLQLPSSLPQSADETRGRGLCAFSSAKQERLLNLLDGRDYDAVDILVNEADRPRSCVALIAAEVANKNNRNTSVTCVRPRMLRLF